MVVESNGFSFSSDLARPHDQRVTLWVEASHSKLPTCKTWWPYQHCDSGNIMTLGSHVISQDDVMKWSCDFMGTSPSR